MATRLRLRSGFDPDEPRDDEGKWTSGDGDGDGAAAATEEKPAEPDPLRVDDAGAGSAFLLTATPIAAQVKDTTCASFKLDSQGIQTVTGSAASTPATCWN